MIIQDLDIHQKFQPLYSPKRYKIYHGGRNGMKTFSFSEALVIITSQSFKRVMCGRQFMNTIEDSVKPSIEKQIYRLGLEREFKIQDRRITNLVTGSTFRFKGLDRNVFSIKGWEDVDIFWGEEANTITELALDLLTKTIRKPGSEIWFSLNRHSRNDAVDKRFLSKNANNKNAIIVKVGWEDNPYLSQEQKDERLYDLEHNADRYPHIWGGEPADNIGKYTILSYEKLLKCVDAHKKLGYIPSGMKHAGLDIADEGNDSNSWALRQEALLNEVREWKVKYLHMTATKADFLNKQNGVSKMYFDAGGMGAGIKSDLARIPKNPGDGSGPEAKKFIPFHFGGKVHGGDRYYIKHRALKVKNKDFFSKANGQAWWNIRLRLENTIKALDGANIDLSKCFFINGNIDNLEKLLTELSQATYDDATGKIVIDKAPDGSESPNLADSVIMCYVSDIRKGLKNT